MVALAALVTTGVVHPAGLEILHDSAPWSFEGTQFQEYMGYSINYAGDLNGDTYEDIVVGSLSYDEPLFPSTGRAWVFYGSFQGLAPDPNVTLTPPDMRLNGGFGVVVTWAGNVNDDEYDDLLVSMHNYSGTLNQEGAVFVYYGSDTGIGTTHDWMARGDQSSLQFGYGAGPASDVNGDDIDDIIVGSTAGAYVYYGSNSGLDADGSRPIGFPGNADWIVHTDQPGSNFGQHVGMAGDVNNDGYSDVWVAAPWYDNGETDEGKVFVWYGSDTGLENPTSPSEAEWSVESNDADSYTGGEWIVPSATSLGDINGDGYGDFLVAAAKYDAVTDMEGIAMLFYGSANGLDPDGSRPLGTPANADWYVVGAKEVDILGYSTGRAGDFNNDGFNDFLIGVLNHDVSNEDNEGMVQLWLGSNSGPKPGSLPRHVDCFVVGVQVAERLGTTVSGAGDVDGDGYDDFIAASIYTDTTEVDAGRVVLFSGLPIVFAEDFESGDFWRVDRVVP